MKKLLTPALALVALAVLSGFGIAQRRVDINQGSVETLVQLPGKTPSLPCCECLGQVTTLNLNTGQSSPIDPIWTVNGNAAYTTPPYPGWMLPSHPLLTPAQWIQPVASPTPSNNVPVGDYKYTVNFNIPRCTIPGDVQLDVHFAADNSAKVLLDGSPIVTTTCQTTCFKAPQAPVSFTHTVSNAINHTLVFVVHNEGGPSGLIVNAKLTRHCARGNPRAQGDLTIEPN
jgi:hypothetical protein